jgi:hypothetical protein
VASRSGEHLLSRQLLRGERSRSGSDDRVRHFHRHGDLHYWFCVVVARRATEKENEKRSPVKKGRLSDDEVIAVQAASDGRRRLGGTNIISEFALVERSRCSREWFDQRLRREWLCEIGEATGLKRSHTNGWVVVPGHVDDRHRIPSSFETMPQLDA